MFTIKICTNAHNLGIDDEGKGLLSSEIVLGAFGNLLNWIYDNFGEAVFGRCSGSSEYWGWEGGIYSSSANCGNIWISSDSPRAIEIAWLINDQYNQFLSSNVP